MKPYTKVLLLLLLLLAIPAGVAFAGTAADRIVSEGDTLDQNITTFGEHLEVRAGATVNGDIAIYGGSATLAGRINGDLTMFGGSVDLTGTVDGDVVLFGGSLQAASPAEVTGECIVLGGSLDDEAGAMHCNRIGRESRLTFPPIGRIAPPLFFESSEWISPPVRLGGLADAIGRSLALGLLALIIGALLPAQLSQVSQAVSRQPMVSGSVGLLTAVAGPSLLVLLALISLVLTLVFCIGILGYPVVFLLAALLVAGIVMGWVAVGHLLGEKLAEALNLKNRSLPATAALGTTVLTLVSSLLGLLPFWLGGWLWSLAAFLLASVGLGAVALTKFGSRPYPLQPAPAKANAMLDHLPPDDVA